MSCTVEEQNCNPGPLGNSLSNLFLRTKQEFEILVFVVPWRKLLLDLLSSSHPSSCSILSCLQLCTQTGPQLGCSGDKNALRASSVSSTHLYPPLLQSLGCPGERDLDHLNPSDMLRKPKLQGGRWLFQASSVVRTGLMMTLSPECSPPGLREGLSPGLSLMTSVFLL